MPDVFEEEAPSPAGAGGAEALRAHLIAHLSATLPGVLTEVELALGIPAGGLPPPTIFEAATTVRLVPLEQWPFLFPIVRDVPLGYDDEGQFGDGRERLFRYTARVYVFGRAQTYEGATRVRDRYAVAVRRCLVGRLGLTGVGGVPVQAIMPENTWRESYSEVNPGPEALRTVGAAYLETQVHLTEVF